MRAILKNYRQSPRKVRLVANLIKGKNVSAAQNDLSFLIKRASDPMKKLLESAIANALENFKVPAENLFVKDVRVEKGLVLKRFMPRAFGRASEIKKRSSHIKIILEEKKPAEIKKPIVKSKK
ncbi:50S ribosomal protein L22 [Candidatus Nomurabacteria bacterium RIFCSPLOWO2_01_FULL_42_20]|uniref:Large ribosomal subunit protein uL22 n=2 Tax=Parcubacteria group TaxID=1794811 RepID=A0A0H4T2Y1_9BACT|nr:50S ribosomal protein L22 [uncultured Parcubacteria bacterium Rifle_16ft_4_minimus_13933]OGI70613.1 MAG: 50S ribosomal protein L22 [Candidatus Nomurabacteria bacterium RIFCSPHIGHO2_01_FULL_42_16]OGI91291.1 MAG: 50S ribosomal protein L22 [Candidatus Nomurabacteria bacterium RIFCSPLOWO2_01_FULL_42_20]